MLKNLNHKVSHVLILIVLIGVVSTSETVNEIIPKGKFTHITGKVGHTWPYFFYFNTQYFITTLTYLLLLIKERSKIDNWVIRVTIFFQILSWASYVIIGWPEPKMLIVSCFFVSLITFIGLRIIYDDNRN